MTLPPTDPATATAPAVETAPEDTHASLYALMTLFVILGLLVVRQNLILGLFALVATAVIFWPLLRPTIVRFRLLFVRR